MKVATALSTTAILKGPPLAGPMGVDLRPHSDEQSQPHADIEFQCPYNTAPQTWPHEQLQKLNPGFLQPLLDQAAPTWPAAASR